VIPVSSLLLQKPFLDRRPPHCPTPGSLRRLLLLSSSSLPPRYLRQFSDRLLLKHIPHRDPYSLLPRSRYYLDAQYRVSSQLEKVLLHSHSFSPQHHSPDPSQYLLHFIPRPCIPLSPS